MITSQQIQRLIALKTSNHLIASLYLNMGRDLRVPKTQFKDLVSNQREKLKQESLSPEEKGWVEKDFEKMRKYIEGLREPRPRSIALFACEAEGIWEAYPLAQPMRDLLTLDDSVHVRPLLAVLSKYRRVFTLLVDRAKARAFEIFMGEGEEKTEIFSDAPKRVREGGWYGLNEKKIDRHVQQHIHDYLKRVADRTFVYSKEWEFDWLLLGGQPEIISDLEGHLHSSLRSRLKRTFRMDLNAPPQEVLRKTSELLQEIKKEEDRALVSRLEEAMMPRGLGVSGIQETLASLHEGSVHSLLIEEGFSEEGAVCPQCAFMALKGGLCPICGKSMTAAPDIADEAVAGAIAQGLEVFNITPGVGLEKLGRIGAMLRYKTASGKK